MMSLRTLITVVALAALLAACDVTITPPPTGPGFDYQVSGEALVTCDEFPCETPPSVRRTISLGAGEEAWIEVTFPSGSSADLMYVELESTTTTEGLQLEWWNRAQTSRQLVSYEAAMFGPPASVSPLTTQAAASERSSIRVAWTCLGPCIARPYTSGAQAIRVFNATGSVRSVQVYAYGLRFADELEPNDSQTAPRTVFVDDVAQRIQGAIEFSGDDDYIRIDCPSTLPLSGLVRLEFDSGFAGDLVLRTTAGDVYPAGDQSALLACPTIVRVFEESNRAGPASTSTYTITIR